MSNEEWKIYQSILKHHSADVKEINALLDEGYDVCTVFSAVQERHYNMKCAYAVFDKHGIALFDNKGCMDSENGPEDGGELLGITLRYFESREDYRKCVILKRLQDMYNQRFRLLHKA